MDDLLPVLHVEIVAMGHRRITILARKASHFLARFQVIHIIGRDHIMFAAAQEAAGIVVILTLGGFQRHRKAPFFVQDFKRRVLPAGHRLTISPQQRVRIEPILVDGFKEAVVRIRQQSIFAGNQHFAIGIVEAVES